MTVQHKQQDRAAANHDSSVKSAYPLCFLVDEDFSVRQDLARELRRHNVDVIEFSNSDRLMDMVDERAPDIVFIEVNRTAPHKCVRALLALKECGYAGTVQLFGLGDARSLESFNTIGADCALTMLPPLAKPIEFATVHRIIQDRKLAGPEAPPNGTSLDVALVRNMVQFVYQPKLELKTRIIVGAELMVRVAHPEHGLLTPDQFMKGTDEDTLLKLSRLALIAALESSIHFFKPGGVALQFSINISASNLLRLPMKELVQMHRPEHKDWPGLLLEVPSHQVANNLQSLKTRMHDLRQFGVSIAIDNFGLRPFPLNVLNELPSAEIKIDRTLVNGCATNSNNANTCKTIVQMAHNFGCKAVGVGISTEADLQWLTEFGCDMGQGFLVGKPINRQQMDALIANFKSRAA